MTALLLLVACSNGYSTGTAVWALNTATVTPSEDGLAGAHTWTFFNSGWEKSQSEDDLVCEIVQELTGSVVAPMTGCEGCSATYEVAFSQVASDCSEELTGDPGLDAVIGFAFGPVPGEVAEDNPYPDQAAGWYLSIDGEVMEGHGFAYAPALDRGEEVQFNGWIVGETFTLAPAYAWEL
jgi:hypothetical protein